MRYLCRSDLYFLLRYVLGRSDLEKQWLFERCKEVEESPNGHIDLWAREHYKSTIITLGKTIQDILATHGSGSDNSEITIGIFSHTRPNAKGFLRQIKREFETNNLLIDLFPDVLYKDPKKTAFKWSEDEGIVVKRRSNPKEATVESWGVVDGQPIGKHFKLLVYDDIVTAESVSSPDMINKTTDMLVLSYSLGAEGGQRRFIGTRYHFNDTYKEVMSRGTAKPRIYAATENGDIEGDPVLLTKERLLEKRSDMGEYIFNCQMMQNPTADGKQGFKLEHIRFYGDKIDHTRMTKYILFDPAGEKKKSNDYSAGWVIGLGNDKNFYILDVLRDRLNLSERATKVFDWHRKYRPLRVGGVRYERYGLQSDIQYMKERMNQENYHFEIQEVAGQTPKNDRIKRLMPYFEQARIWFPDSLLYTDYEGRSVDLIKTFINDEYLSFPVPHHDDMLDALARILEPDLPLVWPEEQERGKIENQTRHLKTTTRVGITQQKGPSTRSRLQKR